MGGAQIKVEGVYIWPFRQLRLVANRYVFGPLFDLLLSKIQANMCFSAERRVILD